MEQVNYYDSIIGGIGALLGAGVATTTITSSLAIAPFGCIAALLVAHALFVRPPLAQ